MESLPILKLHSLGFKAQFNLLTKVEVLDFGINSLLYLFICSHGDMLYLIVKGSDQADDSGVKGQLVVAEDEVDRALAKMDGRVYRERDAQL